MTISRVRSPFPPVWIRPLWEAAGPGLVPSQDPCRCFISDSGKMLTWEEVISEQHEGALGHRVLPQGGQSLAMPFRRQPHTHCSGEGRGQALPGVLQTIPGQRLWSTVAQLPPDMAASSSPGLRTALLSCADFGSRSVLTAPCRPGYCCSARDGALLAGHLLKPARLPGGACRLLVQVGRLGGMETALGEG